MNGTVKIMGGKRLIGEVKPIPNKNAIVAALPLSLLNHGVTTYTSIPDTTDVAKILAIIKN